MNNLPPAYFYPDKFREQAEAFFAIYSLESQLGCPDEKRKNLKKSQRRMCRFCKKSHPNAFFRTDAHIFPEFLGNRYLISDWECDECNRKFGKYEDQLSKFLGVSQTMLAMRGKEKVPKFKAPDGKLTIESLVPEGRKTIIKAERTNTLDRTFEFNEETNTTRITFTKQSYAPLKVYKSLLKMALCCVNAQDVSLYGLAFEFINTDKHDFEWQGMAHIYRTSMPYTYCFLKPAGLLYKKESPSSEAYTHIFVLHALNFIYQLAVPFNAHDLGYSKRSGGIIVPWAPPLFGGRYPLPVETIRQDHLDLSDQTIRRGEIEAVQFSGPPESYRVAQIEDAVTGEVLKEPFDGTKIKAIEFIRDDLRPA